MSKIVSKPTVKQVPKPTSSIGFIEKNALKIAILLGILALAIRLYRIDFLSLWVDEYMHAIAAIHGKFKHGENNGILLTWLNTIFCFVFGKNEFAMRFPVALLGAAIVPAIFVLGKKVANYKVGLIAALLVTCSIYLIFWSRVDRPYGMVAAFYVPLLLCFWLMLEKPTEKDNLFKKIGVNPKYLGLLLIALLLSMLSQLICFLFIFTAGFYGSFVAIESWVTKKSSPLKLNAYNILFYLNVLAVFFMFTSIGNTLMRPIIELFLPPNIASLILPNMQLVLKTFAGENAYKTYDLYYDVVNTDFKYIPFLGFLGIVFAWFKNRKLAYFLFSAYIIPMLLMSFIFREPSHSKYLSYIYPIFLLSTAYAIYFIFFVILPYLNKNWNENNSGYKKMSTVAILALLFFSCQREEIKSLLTTQTHGNVVKKELSEIHFVNWKQPCIYIRDKMRKNDIIMATVQDAPKFYLRTDSILWFRQMHLNPKWSKNPEKERKYIENLPDNRRNSAYTFEQLVKTYNQNDRGWVLADYYFENALTDPRAKQFVEQKMEFHFDACEDGAVKVFSWDKSKPKTFRSNFVVQLGKNPNQVASEPMSININKATLPPKVMVYVLAQGIDSNSEAFLILNQNSNQAIAIQPNGKSNQVGYFTAQINASLFVNGENTIQFYYNGEEGNGDIIKGFVAYDLEFRN